MDKKVVSLLVALPALALFLFLEVTGVISGDQRARVGEIVQIIEELTEEAGEVDTTHGVDTTPSAVTHEELDTVLTPRSDEAGVSDERTAWLSTLTFYPVVRGVDGDTIIISVDGVDERVRFIGVDTPETVHPQRPVECFGKEASAFTTTLVTEAGEVAIEIDESQGERDRFGRLLGYVILPDGRNLNALIIYEGYGHEYTYRTEYKYQAEFKLAEELAREAGRGLWGEGVCE